MNVWLLQIGELSQLLKNGKKMRSAMLAYELASRGHNILWWTSAFDHFEKRWLTHHEQQITLSTNLNVFMLRGLGYKKNLSTRRLADHRILGMKFSRYASRLEPPACIIASLPTLDFAYHASVYSHRKRIPIIVDIRDPWPDAILEALPPRFRSIGRLLLQPEFRRAKFVITHATRLVSVSSTLLKWAHLYTPNERKPQDAVFYIGHESPLPTAGYISPSEFEGISPSHFVVAFVGTVTKNHHNPSILLEAAKKLYSYKDIKFVIAGDGEFLKNIRDAASGLHNVILTGWLNQGQISRLLDRASLGVCPTDRPSILMTNKFFSYISQGLPVLSSFDGDLKRIIEDNELGYYFPPNDVNAFVRLIVDLYSNQLKYKQLSRNCYRTYSNLFSSSVIYSNFARYIEDAIQ